MGEAFARDCQVKMLIGQNEPWGFPKRGGFVRGEISIIGVARAPVAIIIFASNPCENLCVYIGFNKELPHKKAQN